MTINSFDKKNSKELLDKIDRHLGNLSSELGLKIRAKGIRYDQLTATVTLDIKVLETADGKSAAQVLWEQYATVLGLKPEWFGCRFVSGGKQYTLSGLDIGKPARNVHATYNGKTFAFRSDDLSVLFAARPPVKP